jgi:hypothetical protein
MLSSTVSGLAIAVFVISSVAWVSQFRKIRNRIMIRKAQRAQQESEKEVR